MSPISVFSWTLVTLVWIIATRGTFTVPTTYRSMGSFTNLTTGLVSSPVAVFNFTTRITPSLPGVTSIMRPNRQDMGGGA